MVIKLPQKGRELRVDSVLGDGDKWRGWPSSTSKKRDVNTVWEMENDFFFCFVFLCFVLFVLFCLCWLMMVIFISNFSKNIFVNFIFLSNFIMLDMFYCPLFCSIDSNLL